MDDRQTLTDAHIRAHYEAIYALADMVAQFGYPTKFRKQDAVCNGGLSALEYAFGALEDCGCKINSNGTITLKNLFAFQDSIKERRLEVTPKCDTCKINNVCNHSKHGGFCSFLERKEK